MTVNYNIGSEVEVVQFGRYSQPHAAIYILAPCSQT